jgi:hypothetical protein
MPNPNLLAFQHAKNVLEAAQWLRMTTEEDGSSPDLQLDCGGVWVTWVML